MSADAKISSAVFRIFAPTRVYMSSVRPMASPALVSTNTSCPRAVNSSTAAGIMPTRYSWFLISFGTSRRMRVTSVDTIHHGEHALGHALDFAIGHYEGGRERDPVARDADDHVLFEEA